METGTSTVRDLAAEIRPGVFRPDWSVVTAPAAREALSGRMAAREGLLDRWSHALEAGEDLVWRIVLQLYADKGQPPRPGAVADQTGIATARVVALLRNLQLRDLIGLDPDGEGIRYAYPFTETPTGHRVELKANVLNALCAVDALGVASMYGTDITVESSCRQCGQKIRFTTADKGRALSDLARTEAVVWYDLAYSDSAAASCCPAIAFFCSDEHLRQWLNAKKPRREGVRLTLAEALQLGRAIFGPVLVT